MQRGGGGRAREKRCNFSHNHKTQKPVLQQACCDNGGDHPARLNMLVWDNDNKLRLNPDVLGRIPGLSVPTTIFNCLKNPKREQQNRAPFTNPGETNIFGCNAGVWGKWGRVTGKWGRVLF